MDDSTKFWVTALASTLIMVVDAVLVVMSALPMWAFWLILAVAVIMLFVPILSFKGTQASVSDGRLRVKAPFVDVDVPLSSIQAVECRTEFDMGLRMYGYGGISSGSGDFTNREFGSYTFAGTKKIPLFIVVRHGGKRILAFNVGSEAETMALYRELAGLSGKVGAVISPDESEKAAKGHRTMRNFMVAFIIMAVAIVIAVVALTMTGGHVDVSMDEDGLEVDATMMHEDIQYSDISHIELRDYLDYGVRVGGFGGSDISSGNFRNDEFGSYGLAVHNDVHSFIIVHRTDGSVVVFNLENKESTESFFEELSDRMDYTGAPIVGLGRHAPIYCT